MQTCDQRGTSSEFGKSGRRRSAPLTSMRACAAAIRPVVIIGFLIVLAAGCRFPEACDLYPGPVTQAALDGSSAALQSQCSSLVRYQGRSYKPEPGVLVTNVGDPIEGVTLGACKNGDRLRGDEVQSVTAFEFRTYCTNDVIAVELTPGEQLTVYTATD